MNIYVSIYVYMLSLLKYLIIRPGMWVCGKAHALQYCQKI